MKKITFDQLPAEFFLVWIAAFRRAQGRTAGNCNEVEGNKEEPKPRFPVFHLKRGLTKGGPNVNDRFYNLAS
jgi:hypothetical protein